MIIKFRDSALKRKRGPGLVSEIEEGLRQEIALLRRNEEHHPDVLHWALRAQQLEERVAALELEKEQGQWRGSAEDGDEEGEDGATEESPHVEELRRVREVRDALGRRVATLVEERHALLDEVAALQAVGMAPITPGSLRGAPRGDHGATPASEAPSPASRVQRSGQATGGEASPVVASDVHASPAVVRPSRSPSVSSPVQSPAAAPDMPASTGTPNAGSDAVATPGPVTPLPTAAIGASERGATPASAVSNTSPAPRSVPPRSARMRSLGAASTPESPAAVPGSARSHASASSNHSAGTHASRASGASSVASLPLRRQVLMHVRVPGSAGPAAAWRQSPFTTPARQRRQLLDVELAKGRYEEQIAALRKDVRVLMLHVACPSQPPARRTQHGSLTLNL